MPQPAPTPNRPARRYVATLLLFLAAGLICVLAINLAADPLCVFGQKRLRGFNDRLPNTAGFDYQAKPYEMLRHQPRTVVMGSSTAHSGFIDIADWPVDLPQPVFNYALLGANEHVVRLSLEQAIRENDIRTAIVVADFFAFNAHYADNERFKASRLQAASRSRWPGYTLEDLGAFALGIDSLRLGVQTLCASRTHTDGPRQPQTVWLTHFRNCEQSYREKWLPGPAHRYDFSDAAGRDRLNDFDAILRLCAQRQVHLIILFPPLHARFQEAIASLGLWPTYETFKKAVYEHVQASRAETGPTAKTELWDFSLFNDSTCEPVPADGAGEMTWWGDSAHFTPALGKRLLAEILTPSPAPGLGVRLLPGNVAVDDHLARIRNGLDAFRAASPDVVADVRAVFGLKEPLPPLPCPR